MRTALEKVITGRQDVAEKQQPEKVLPYTGEKFCQAVFMEPNHRLANSHTGFLSVLSQAYPLPGQATVLLAPEP